MPYQDGDLQVNLEGKIAVITGGSGYLCSEMGCVLSRNGAKVIILGRRQEKIDEALEKINTEGTPADGLSVDVTDRKAVEEAYNTIKKKWGDCDILINGAGGNNAKVICNEEFCSDTSIENPNTHSFFDINIDDIADNVDLNFTSAIICSQLFGRDMVKKKSGNIINLSSMSTHASITRVMSYGASKAALDNFTQWLAVYFSRVGVRVNAIAPGFFIGEQNRRLLLEEDNSYTSRGQKIINNTPMDRFGTADELSSTLLYLVSPQSKFVTGLIIPVDGGFSCFSGV